MRRHLVPLAAVTALVAAQAAIVLSAVPWALSASAETPGPVAGAGGSGAPPDGGSSLDTDLRLDGSAGIAHISSISAVRASSPGHGATSTATDASTSSTSSAPSGPAYSYPVTWGTPISGKFGDVSSDWPRGHAGLDFNGDYGDPVFAATDGKVTYATYNEGGYGNLVMIMRKDGTQTRYAHLSKILVKQGQRVHAGDRIGKIGATGAAFGAHLHFEVRVGPALTPTNPDGLWSGPKPGIPAKPPRWACRNFGC